MFSSGSNDPQYQLYTEFQSHNAEFDYLKSLEIEEKINQIKWCRPSNGSQCLLSTNDKTIKLWKIHERSVREVTTFNEQGLAHVPRANITPALIRLPQTHVRGHVTTSTAKRVYANAHTYHINSIAINSDGETFMSADDLRVNLWSLGNSDQSFSTLLRLFPTECARCKLTQSFPYCTNVDRHCGHQASEHGGAHGGYHGCGLPPNTLQHDDVQHKSRVHQAWGHAPGSAVRLVLPRYASPRARFVYCCGLAQFALTRWKAVFEEQEDPEARSFFSEIIASISDIKFSPDGRYIIARDFLTLKVWDINMNSRPVQTINVSCRGICILRFLE